MKYKIIEELYTVDLEREVNEAIKQGYTPIGGVCCDTAYGSRSYYYQAMVLGGKNE